MTWTSVVYYFLSLETKIHFKRKSFTRGRVRVHNHPILLTLFVKNPCREVFLKHFYRILFSAIWWNMGNIPSLFREFPWQIFRNTLAKFFRISSAFFRFPLQICQFSIANSAELSSKKNLLNYFKNISVLSLRVFRNFLDKLFWISSIHFSEFF